MSPHQARRKWHGAALWALCLLPATGAVAASADPFEAAAAQLVAEALQSNLALQGAELDVDQAQAALQAARARWWPEIGLAARYTWADGGRQIEFPLGQLLNPAYQTLNELLVAQGQGPRFAPLPDQRFDFQRSREQDTRLSLRQALYQPAIPAAIDAQRALLEGRQFARVVVAQQLRRDVVLALAAWLRTTGLLRVLEEQRGVLQVHVQQLQARRREGLLTQDRVLRAEAELLAIEQQLRQAQGAERQARAGLNFLRNQPLDQPLPALDASALGSVDTTAPALAEGTRAELGQVDAALDAAAARVRLATATRSPQLSLGVDAGTQGERYRLGPGYDYVMASLVVSWRFFDGGASRAAAAEARAAVRRTEVLKDETVRRIELEVLRSREALAVAQAGVATASARDQAATAALRMAQRQRDEGVLEPLLFLDTQAAARAAREGLLDAHLALRAAHADLAYATGSAALP